MNRIVVIGGGPSGMMAAASAAENGAHVVLLEKNEKLGKKLYITGKGRCNITNDTDVEGLLTNTVTNPRFLNSAFYTMDSQTLMAFPAFAEVPFKTERGGRVFPQSDKADDINRALEKYLQKLGVKTFLNTAVKKIIKNNTFMVTTHAKTYEAEAVIIATGGLSYPSTGSTGDGYEFAKKMGHTVTETNPALVPLITAETWVKDLEGLSLKNVCCTAKANNKTVYEETGEMLFTRKGVTGPLILSASAYLSGRLADKNASLSIDLKPALSTEQLDARILRDFEKFQNKNFANALDELLPKRIITIIIELSGISPHKKVNSITKKERAGLVSLLKNLHLTPTSTAGYNEAVITKGGINVREINPSTLMSKKTQNLFFAGEVLDVDALTGGYNLQIAFSTGRLAGLSAAGS
ncbi:MAG: NAD(P)/FAD-dependent oxidoreductase [Defluviitaleaceae bacterium]|nr:NAD(P)/FAD-dependent oxidoreductase [Defluviitaleaceae bacterium]